MFHSLPHSICACMNAYVCVWVYSIHNSWRIVVQITCASATNLWCYAMYYTTLPNDFNWPHSCQIDRRKIERKRARRRTSDGHWNNEEALADKHLDSLRGIEWWLWSSILVYFRPRICIINRFSRRRSARQTTDTQMWRKKKKQRTTGQKASAPLYNISHNQKYNEVKETSCSLAYFLSISLFLSFLHKYVLLRVYCRPQAQIDAASVRERI